MSDKIIRIASQQGFAEEWVNDANPSKLNLVDFEIPSGMVVDLTKSYIAFNTQIKPQAQALVTDAAGGGGAGNQGEFDTDTPINAMLRLNTLNATGQSYEAPNACLIKNASISCDKGQIENIRRVDTLKSALFNMEHDREERKDDMNAFTAPKGDLGINNQSSYFIDFVSRNTDDAGNILTGATSRQLARDVKVPLKSVFGIAEGAEAWDTSKFGTTRIHCETNWKNVAVNSLGGAENTSFEFGGPANYGNTGIHWGSMENVAGIAANTGTLTEVFTKVKYDNPQQNSPFFVGQRVLVTGTFNVVGTYTNIPFVIQKIQHITDPADTNFRKLKITFDPNINPNGILNNSVAPRDLTNITMKADNTYTPNITVNRAELVLFTRPDMPSPSEYQYVTYSTEEDNGNALTSFARGYTMEGQAEQMIVCLSPANEILPTTVYESYRYAVNNEDMTGNRDIEYQSPLQYDRLSRALDNQYTDWRSAQLKFFNQSPNAQSQLNSYNKNNSTIVETLPLSDRPKYVDIQVESAAGVADIKIYKQMVKSIKA